MLQQVYLGSMGLIPFRSSHDLSRKVHSRLQVFQRRHWQCLGQGSSLPIIPTPILTRINRLTNLPTSLPKRFHGARTALLEMALAGQLPFHQLSLMASISFDTKFLAFTLQARVWEPNSIPRVLRSESVVVEKRTPLALHCQELISLMIPRGY